MNDLPRDLARRSVLLEHLEMLRQFAAKQGDRLVDNLLADDVGSRPFPKVTTFKKTSGSPASKAGAKALNSR